MASLLRAIAAVVLCCAVVISAAPQYRQQQVYVQPLQNYTVPYYTVTTPVAILSQSDESSPDGSFNSAFETANGIRQQVSGFHKSAVVPRLLADGTKTGEQEQRDILAQTGSFSYTAPDGTVYSLSYIADENGFQPIAEHLPTSPPIPQPILDSLQLQQQQQQQVSQQ